MALTCFLSRRFIFQTQYWIPIIECSILDTHYIPTIRSFCWPSFFIDVIIAVIMQNNICQTLCKSSHCLCYQNIISSIYKPYHCCPHSHPLIYPPLVILVATKINIFFFFLIHEQLYCASQWFCTIRLSPVNPFYKLKVYRMYCIHWERGILCIV